MSSDHTPRKESPRKTKTEDDGKVVKNEEAAEQATSIIGTPDRAASETAGISNLARVYSHHSYTNSHRNNLVRIVPLLEPTFISQVNEVRAVLGNLRLQAQ